MSYIYAQPQYQVQPQMIPTQMPQMAYASALPTHSIQYVNQAMAPTTIIPTANYGQTNIITSSPRTTYAQYGQNTYSTAYAGQPIQMANQVMASAMPAAMTSQVVMTGAGCPPPVQGQPIVIEGAVMGAQSYIEPVKQTVVLSGAQLRPELSQVMRGESRFEYVPYEQVVTEYDQLEKRIRIPFNRYITEYQVIDHQIEYIPEISYQTQTDYIPTQRVEEEVQYSTQEKRIEHGIKQEMRTSQRVEGAAIATTTIAQPSATYIQQPIAQYSQQVVRSSFTPATTYQQTYAAQAPMMTYAAQSPMQTYATQASYVAPMTTYAQAPMTTYANQAFAPQVQTSYAAYGAQIPGGQQWPTAWNYGKRKSS